MAKQWKILVLRQFSNFVLEYYSQNIFCEKINLYCRFGPTAQSQTALLGWYCSHREWKTSLEMEMERGREREGDYTAVWDIAICRSPNLTYFQQDFCFSDLWCSLYFWQIWSEGFPVLYIHHSPVRTQVICVSSCTVPDLIVTCSCKVSASCFLLMLVRKRRKLWRVCKCVCWGWVGDTDFKELKRHIWVFGCRQQGSEPLNKADYRLCAFWLKLEDVFLTEDWAQLMYFYCNLTYRYQFLWFFKQITKRWQWYVNIYSYEQH